MLEGNLEWLSFKREQIYQMSCITLQIDKQYSTCMEYGSFLPNYSFYFYHFVQLNFTLYTCTLYNFQLCKYVHLFAVQHYSTLVRDKDKQRSVTVIQQE